MRTSEEGVALIKKFEGCELSSYQCSAGVFTIGYGHTLGVEDGDSCTQEEADQMLVDDLEEFENYVNDIVETELTQNEFDALVSFSFNVGLGNFQSSTLRSKLNRKDYEGAANEFWKWRRAGGRILPGLVKRRADEKALFVS